MTNNGASPWAAIAEPQPAEVYKEIINSFHDLGETDFHDSEEAEFWAEVKTPDLGLTVGDPDLSAGKWLTDYTAYAKQRSPMSPEIFHEAAGLFLLSAAVARRVALKTKNGNIYPNLFVLIVGPPGIVHKTGAVNVADDMSDKANLLMLPAIGTTESLSIELSATKQYSNFSVDTDPVEYGRWYRERALAGQRALIMNEVSGLFEAGRKDYMAQFREFLLKVYDCPRKLPFGLTVSRGRATVENAYLSLLGDTTPAAMRPYFSRSAREWTDGTFSRFGLVTFEEKPDYQYFLNGNGDNQEVPTGDLAKRLNFLHYKYCPMPKITQVPIETDDDGNATKVRLEVSPLMERGVTLGAGVVEAMQQHHQAVNNACWDAYTGSRDERLAGLYVRLHTTAIKIAILLATIDASDDVQAVITIGLVHWNRAVWISERWRRSLHRLDSLISRDLQPDSQTKQTNSSVESDASKVESFIRERGECKKRDLTLKFSFMKNGRLDLTLDYLRTHGRIDQSEVKPERGRVAEIYRIKG